MNQALEYWESLPRIAVPNIKIGDMCIIGIKRDWALVFDIQPVNHKTSTFWFWVLNGNFKINLDVDHFSHLTCFKP